MCCICTMLAVLCTPPSATRHLMQTIPPKSSQMFLANISSMSSSSFPVLTPRGINQAKMSSTSDSSLPILTKFSLEERGERVEVQPVWLLVHQEHPGGPARYTAAPPCPALPCPAWHSALWCCFYSLPPVLSLVLLPTADLCWYHVPVLPISGCTTSLHDCL